MPPLIQGVTIASEDFETWNTALIEGGILASEDFETWDVPGDLIGGGFLAPVRLEDKVPFRTRHPARRQALRG